MSVQWPDCWHGMNLFQYCFAEWLKPFSFVLSFVHNAEIICDLIWT